MKSISHPIYGAFIRFLEVVIAFGFITLMLMGATVAHGQSYSAVNLTWQEASNRLQGSAFQVWHGAIASHNYDGYWPAQSNSMTVTVSMLGPGPHYVAVSQISTNQDGTAVLTTFSGEVDFNSFQDAVIQPGISNLVLECSTNLGQSWQETGTNPAMVPTAGEPQAFYRGRANFIVTIQMTNLIEQITNAP